MRKIFNWFLQLLELKHNDPDISRQIGVVFILGICGIVSVSAFGLKNYLSGFYILSLVLFLIVIVVTFGLIHLKKTKKPYLAGYIEVVLMLVILIYMLFIGVEGNKTWGMFWFYIYPPVTIFILGIRKGLIFLILSVIMLLLTFNYEFLLKPSYPLGMKSRFIFSYIVVSIMIIAFEYLRKVSYNKMIKSDKDKTDALNKVILQHDELQTQKYQIESQKDKLEKKQIIMEYMVEKLQSKNKAITDSIVYAKRIQNGILPVPNYLNKYIPESFIFFKPKDIVSGDFYWIKETQNHLYLAAADCTGHGVPGAFMSLIGYNLLETIIYSNSIILPSELLNLLREQLIKRLKDHNKDTIQLSDGMDIALVRIDKKERLLHYAGAFNPLYIINNKTLSIINANKFPVGRYIKTINTPFTDNVYSINKNDMFYIFSDGYKDQLNKEGTKKFYSANFKKLLINISQETMQNQKEILEKTMIEFKQEQDQCDDMLIIGFKPYIQ